jgi:REP element-mobilizing transposase RayT
MVIAYHCVVAAYGFWLPNDPRGSWSDYVRKSSLAEFGPATKTTARHSVASKRVSPEAWQRNRQAKQSLDFPPVRFNAEQIQAIAAAIADGVARSGFLIYAASLMWDHAHWVIGRHRYSIEQVINRLKGAATRELTARNLHPLARFAQSDGSIPSPWAAGLWKVFLNTPADVERAIQYTDRNPERANLPPQVWPFIKPYHPQPV